MSWTDELASALGSPVAELRAVGGGDINDAYRVALADRRVVFAKHDAAAPAGLFASEAWGLGWLAAGSLRVPRVLAAGAHWLALEWLELAGDVDPAAFGCGLAMLHGLGAPGFGLDRASFLATIALDNRPATDVVTFWVERRLRPLAARARELGRAPDLDAALDRLRERADRFGPAEPPARLHGDLWWGNVAAIGGAPVIFDPAAYGGSREVDLAMLALFGGVPDALVRAYEEVAPLADGWRDRVTLWQLVPLLAHAVLFGGGYGGRAARELARLL